MKYGECDTRDNLGGKRLAGKAMDLLVLLEIQLNHVDTFVLQSLLDKS